MAHSLSRVAEELVRAGRGDALHWHDVILSTHFQPVFAVHRGTCVGYESLIRAVLPDGRTVAAAQLFDEAIDAGDGVLLDWLCRALHLRNFATIDPGDRQLFMNLHPEAAVKDAGCETQLAQLIRYYGLAPRRVFLEILQAGCADEGLLSEAVEAYRGLGASIAMAGFGLGCSNFERIASLRPDVVKVDRRMLAQAVGDSKARRLLPSVVELLHETGARVAVEGIETVNEALIAMDAGADYLQGYYFARPGPRLADESMGTRMLSRLRHMAPGPAVVGTD